MIGKTLVQQVIIISCYSNNMGKDEANWQMIGKQSAMIVHKNCISKSLVINWYKTGK